MAAHGRRSNGLRSVHHPYDPVPGPGHSHIPSPGMDHRYDAGAPVHPVEPEGAAGADDQADGRGPGKSGNVADAGVRAHPAGPGGPPESAPSFAVRASAPLPESTGVPARARATVYRVMCEVRPGASSSTARSCQPSFRRSGERPRLRLVALPAGVDFAAASPLLSLGDWLNLVGPVELHLDWDGPPPPEAAGTFPVRAALLTAAAGALMPFCTPFQPPAAWPLALVRLLPAEPGDLDALALVAASVFGGSQACRWSWQGPVFHGSPEPPSASSPTSLGAGHLSASPGPLQGVRVELRVEP